MSEVSNKRFVHFDGTKEEFIAGGYPSTYTDSIVFINGDGNESNNTIYTHGEYYGQGVIVEGDASYSAVLKGEHKADNNKVYSNKAISKISMAVGAGTTAGLKGWYYTHVNISNKQIFLSTEQSQITQKFSKTILGQTITLYPDSDYINSSFVSGYKVGDVLSLVYDSKYEDYATITAISGNVITLDNVPFVDGDFTAGVCTSVIAGIGDLKQPDEFSVYCIKRDFNDTTKELILSKYDVGGVDFGGGALSEGIQTYAVNTGAHAEGAQNVAKGQYSHAEGLRTQSNYAAHAEGRSTWAKGAISHAEGDGTIASGLCAHAQGKDTKAHGYNSHTEGQCCETYSEDVDNQRPSGGNSEKLGQNAHAEGRATFARGNSSHAEGGRTMAYANNSHSEGWETEAYGPNSHVEGFKSATGDRTLFDSISANTNSTPGANAHAEGNVTLAMGRGSHSEGEKTQALGIASHAEGQSTRTGGADEDRPDGNPGTTTGQNAHAEGAFTFAQGAGSHAEGGKTWSKANYSHSEGYKSISSGPNSHAEGQLTRTGGEDADRPTGSTGENPGQNSHAEGAVTFAQGAGSHAEGGKTWASGKYSHAEGYATRTYKDANNSHAEGFYTETTRRAEHAEGEYNLSNGNTIHSVGIGTTDTKRKNAHEITIEGKHYIYNIGGYDGTNPTSSKDLATILYTVGSSDKTKFIVNNVLNVKNNLNVTKKTTLEGELCINNLSDDYIPEDFYIMVGEGTSGVSYNIHHVVSTYSNGFKSVSTSGGDADGVNILWIINDDNSNIFNPETITNQIIRINVNIVDDSGPVKLFVMIQKTGIPSTDVLYTVNENISEGYALDTFVTDNTYICDYCDSPEFGVERFGITIFESTNNKMYQFVSEQKTYEFNYFAGEISCRPVFR